MTISVIEVLVTATAMLVLMSGCMFFVMDRRTWHMFLTYQFVFWLGVTAGTFMVLRVQ